MSCTNTMKTRLLELLSREWVTPVIALDKVGCFSLAQRCSNFIADGMPIEKKWVKTPGGAKVRAYRLGN